MNFIIRSILRYHNLPSLVRSTQPSSLWYDWCMRVTNKKKWYIVTDISRLWRGRQKACTKVIFWISSIEMSFSFHDTVFAVCTLILHEALIVLITIYVNFCCLPVIFRAWYQRITSLFLDYVCSIVCVNV